MNRRQEVRLFELGSLVVLSTVLWMLDTNINDVLLAVLKGTGILGLAVAIAIGVLWVIRLFKDGDRKGGDDSGLRLWMSEQFTRNRHDTRNVVSNLGPELEGISEKLDRLHALDRIVELLEDIKAERRKA